uniref:Asteropsin A n=1 Tax=Asteropus TaxID=350938 RepID=I1SB10_9METZ
EGCAFEGESCNVQFYPCCPGLGLTCIPGNPDGTCYYL